MNIVYQNWSLFSLSFAFRISLLLYWNKQISYTIAKTRIIIRSLTRFYSFIHLTPTQTTNNNKNQRTTLNWFQSTNNGRSDTESHVYVDKSEKRKFAFNFNLNNLFKNRSEKGKSSQPNDVEDGKLSNDEDDNAAPSESTVIVEDEPTKKVMKQSFFSIRMTNFLMNVYQLTWSNAYFRMGKT